MRPNGQDPAAAAANEITAEHPVFTHHDSSSSNSTLNEKPNEEFLETQPVKKYEKLKNPLTGIPKDQLMRDVETFALEKGLLDNLEDLKKGALVAQNPSAFESFPELSEEDKNFLRMEKTHRWNQPWQMYFLTILCAGSAIVQGMDQTAVNGAQLFYFEEFGITNVWQQGLLNGAPYLCSALIGCWTTAPLNRWFGRRGCIFISCFISFASSFWMAAAHTWWSLLLARFLLGFAVGAKSTTTPVYGAECSPTAIRGALTMMWQMWTAFGIMLGFVSSVAFYSVPNLSGITGLNWRLMLGSTAIPPMFVCAQVYLCPESPRWYMTKNKYRNALDSLLRLRRSPLQACRDLYSIHAALEVENKMREGKSLWREFFMVARNRRAAQSSFFVMFMQQFCGVNVIAYYSSQIFVDADLGRQNALLVSLGTGIVNFLFAIPAVYTIDTFGRRNLLLTTFPLMAICLFFTGFSFWIPTGDPARIGCIATGIYLFMVVYSPGAGPVPFTYSAEAFPLYVRDIGMSFATATCWGFNFILSLTWPALVQAFTNQGAFSWYAAWNLFAWVFAYFCLPETKGRTLEELDAVFEVATRKHAAYYRDSLPWYWSKYVRRADVEPRKDLYDVE